MEWHLQRRFKDKRAKKRVRLSVDLEPLSTCDRLFLAEDVGSLAVPSLVSTFEPR